MVKIINLIVGMLLLTSFIFILIESLNQERPKKIWVMNCFNLILGLFNISIFFLY